MEIKTEVGYTKNIKCQDVHTESSAEYVLPDYLGDVRKILFTSASVRPAGRLVGGDRVECSGIVAYNMIYLDAEDNLSSAEFTSDYDYSLKCPTDSCRDIQADTRASGYSVRLVGPRKIAAKASIIGSAMLTCDEKLAISVDALPSRGEPELAKRRINIRHTEISSIMEREYAEVLTKLDSAIAEEVSVIHCDAKATVESAEYDDGAVKLKGKFRICAMIKNGESGAYLAEKALNFEESVPFEKADEDMKFLSDITLTSLKPVVNACEDGCEVVLSGILELSVTGEKNDTLEVVTDGYLKECASACDYEEFTYLEFVDLASEKTSHSASVPRSEIESGKIREVIFLNAEPRVDSLTKESDGLKILGEIKYSGVASELDEEGNISYVMLKFSSPFDINVNNDCQKCDKIRYDVKIKAHNASASIDSENLSVSCSLEVTGVICEEKSQRILASMSAKESEPYVKEGGKITVYYPTAEDTLFSVSKRFHTSPVKVAADNALTEAVMLGENEEGRLLGVRKLIIY